MFKTQPWLEDTADLCCPRRTTREAVTQRSTISLGRPLCRGDELSSPSVRMGKLVPLAAEASAEEWWDNNPASSLAFLTPFLESCWGERSKQSTCGKHRNYVVFVWDILQPHIFLSSPAQTLIQSGQKGVSPSPTQIITPCLPEFQAVISVSEQLTKVKSQVDMLLLLF